MRDTNGSEDWRVLCELAVEVALQPAERPEFSLTYAQGTF